MSVGEKTKRHFLHGLRNGVPIMLGYFAVALAVGLQASRIGLSPWLAGFASFLTNASAGEYAGFIVIAENSGLLTMALMTVVASSRYLLMSAALSQHYSPSVKLGQRLLLAYEITDETFGLEIAYPGEIPPAYTYGLMVLPILGWSTGTIVGALLGDFLPANVTAALSVALFGMFIVIFVQPMKKDRKIIAVVFASFALSFLLSRLPAVSNLSSGIRIIITTVVIAVLAALLFPVKDGEEKENGD